MRLRNTILLGQLLSLLQYPQVALSGMLSDYGEEAWKSWKLTDTEAKQLIHEVTQIHWTPFTV